MTVILNLKPELEKKVAQQAAAEGTAVSYYLEKLIEETVTPEPAIIDTQAQILKNQAALAMLRQWNEEDATDDPAELEKRQVEWEEFKAAMNESHSSDRVLFP